MVRKEALEAGVPPADFMRMQMEALRPQTVISAYDSILKRSRRTDANFFLALYAGESRRANLGSGTKQIGRARSQVTIQR
jgi:hypothetical protein